jgi:hypothetical protein
MAVNQHIAARLAGIQSILMGAHQASSTVSTASRGLERAAFVDTFLREVLTPQFRFGQGDATDVAGNRSGQLDIVVEYPWVPSLPIVGSSSVRLYLAEGIAAVIEVKSDLAKQWEEVKQTSALLKRLERRYDSGVIFGGGMAPPKQIPLFAVGYTGWKTMETVRERLNDGIAEGILVIDSQLFASVSQFQDTTESGALSLWGLIACLHQVTSVISSLTNNVPFNYAEPGAPEREGM